MIDDINSFNEEHAADGADALKSIDTLSKTRLSAPAEIFRKFVRNLEASERSSQVAVARKDVSASMEW